MQKNNKCKFSKIESLKKVKSIHMNIPINKYKYSDILW